MARAVAACALLALLLGAQGHAEDDAVDAAFHEAWSKLSDRHPAQRIMAVIGATTSSFSKACMISLVGGQGINATAVFGSSNGPTSAICNSLAGTFTAVENLDPPIGSFFPNPPLFPSAAAGSAQSIGVVTRYYNPTLGQAGGSFVGMPLQPQAGWGGGPNVSMAPPTTNTVWGAHSTPATATAVSTPAGTVAVLLSWRVGNFQLNVTAPSSPAWVSGPSPGSFKPAATFSHTISMFLNGAGAAQVVTPASSTCIQFFRPYPTYGAFNDSNGNVGPAGSAAPTCTASNINYGGWPGANGTCFKNASSPACADCAATANALSGWNYLSPYICHAYVTTLAPGVSYGWTVSTTVTAGSTTTTYGMPAATYSANQPAMYYFTAPASPSPQPAGSNTYPLQWVVSGDPGETYNSSLTAQYMAAYGVNTGIDMWLNVGDYTYADNFSPKDTLYGVKPSAGTSPQKWDAFEVMWQPVFALGLHIGLAGNHEMEALPGYPYNPSKYTDTASSYGMATSPLNIPYQSFAARFPNGAQPVGQLGDIWTNLYYSQNLGPVHVIILCNYIPFTYGTDQYNWFLNDLMAVNRTATPWLIVAFHAPPYHSYYVHYKEMECMLSQYEALFYQYRVDFVLNGHVHAYERTHPMYNYQPDVCGPVYVTIGDGGNVEGPYRNFVDEIVPGSSATFCATVWNQAKFNISAAAAGAASTSLYTCPTYQLTAQAPNCNPNSWQTVPASAGVILNPNGGVGYWCQNQQPAWSAYRDPSFGFMGLTFLDDNSATLSWFRNADQNASVSQDSTYNPTATDTGKYTRYMGQCANVPPNKPPPPPMPSPPPPRSPPLTMNVSLPGSYFVVSGVETTAASILLAALAAFATLLAL